MTNLDLIEQIRGMAQQLVGDIAQGVDTKDLHGQALELLLKIVEIQNQISSSSGLVSKEELIPSTESKSLVAQEINKVSRKLPKWARNQGQINSRILTLYLSLRRKGSGEITENMLSNEYGNTSEFYRNYPQMKSISPKNHAKVFDSVNGVIKIWEPVKHYVDEYERVVFKEKH